MGEKKVPHQECNPMRAFFLIPKMPSPKFSNEKMFSKTFRDFLRLCVIKEPEERSSATELLKHDFVKNCVGGTVLSDLVNEVFNTFKKYGGRESFYKVQQERVREEFEREQKEYELDDDEEEDDIFSDKEETDEIKEEDVKKHIDENIEDIHFMPQKSSDTVIEEVVETVTEVITHNKETGKIVDKKVVEKKEDFEQDITEDIVDETIIDEQVIEEIPYKVQEQQDDTVLEEFPSLNDNEEKLANQLPPKPKPVNKIIMDIKTNDPKYSVTKRTTVIRRKRSIRRYDPYKRKRIIKMNMETFMEDDDIDYIPIPPPPVIPHDLGTISLTFLKEKKMEINKQNQKAFLRIFIDVSESTLKYDELMKRTDELEKKFEEYVNDRPNYPCLMDNAKGNFIMNKSRAGSRNQGSSKCCNNL